MYELKPVPPIFNPSNDMALAAPDRQEYSPPKLIRQMEEDLAGLASYWDYGPWGWSRQTRRRYERMGIDRSLLPDDEWLDEVKRLSSREFAVGYIKELLNKFKSELLLGDEMQFHADLTGIRSDRIFKSLWSSSGRGIFTPHGLSKEHLNERLQALLKAHGGYVSDRFYESRQQDFALEFFVDAGGKVEFLGYSVFAADTNGTYKYNIVDSQERLRSNIPVPDDILQALVDYHKAHLGTTDYRGYVGIDMFTTADGRIHPVVEINFRMNMGILALNLFRLFGANANVLLTPHRENGFEAKIEEGKLQLIKSASTNK